MAINGYIWEKKFMFLTQSFLPQNRFWKYLVGSAIVILAAFAGQIPLMIAILAKSMATGLPVPDTNSEVMRYLESNTTLFLLLLSFVVALAGLYLVVRFLHKQPFASIVTARAKTDWSRVGFAFIVWGTLLAVTTWIGFMAAPEDYIVQFQWDKFLILAAVAVPLVPIQTSVEELIFRGYLMQGFANLSRNRLFPLIMTSVIFGTMHILNPEVEVMGYIIMVFYVGTGLFLGVVTLMDDGTELALGFHAANNLVAALLVTADWTAFRTDSVLRDVSLPDAGFDVVLPVLVVYPIVLFIFSKRYHWSGWEQKLSGPIQIEDHDTDSPDTRLH